jgi:hypothetical protein
MAVRERIDRRNALTRKYTALQSFTFEGRKYANGDPFPIDGLPLHQVMTLHGARHIDLVPLSPESEEPPAEDRGVTLTEKGGGNYEITAAWLDEPLKVRGRDAANAEAERVRNEGPPLGFIEGGSDVTIEQLAGGWYAINAPWLEMPEKVQGRDLAQERQRAIHDAGEPAEHHGVALTESANGWFDVKADWLPESEKVQGRDAAVARANELRAQGDPAKPKPLSPWESSVLISIEQSDNGPIYVLSAPNLPSPERYRIAEVAESRQKELRDAGPPEGWTPPQA